MNTSTKNCHLKHEITLWESEDFPLTLRAVDLLLIKQNRKITECRLTFQVTPELYQHIDTQALFNLKPEIRSPISGKALESSHNIQIDANLDSDLLPQLTKHAKTNTQALAYLQHLSQEQPNHPLLSPHSWYALKVKQQQDKGEVGYSTLWLYLKPSDITSDGIDNKKLNEAMFDFAKELANTNQLHILEKDISKDISKILNSSNVEFSQLFEQHITTELTNNISKITEEAVSQTFEQITNAFDEFSTSISEITEVITTNKDIFETTIKFFQEQNWQFEQISGEETLHLAFQGKNGKWNCFAKIRSEQQQMIFYSICPITTPESKRSAVAEFITRANYGLAMGNFELDFSDGEIRFKTSIDVEGGFLTSELLEGVVYANVTMMDEYLPGIIAVIKNDTLPVDAIAQLES
ncbi:YbjN domain-containing protein [Nostoc sp. FACHB-888]|uniref:YbjN domain-containing protein n=1 Tax=Nostoc sp. FACHB-888 TaxID=2692842 RepID=UPI00168A2890|nr:YbjN domain-containing protein [Nostoc sp. FACHB-888]MBD2245324.1 YbjN domain-containing protein [Nostoc sp. FACHB-888]